MRLSSIVYLLVASFLLVNSAPAQVAERKSKVTGPKGNSIERDIRVQRGPDGSIDRTVDIKRPGGELHRETIIPGRPQPIYGGGYRGPTYVERDIIIERPAPPPFFGFGLGAPLLGLSFGSSPAPPPPVVYAPAPVYVPPPNVVYSAPNRYQPQQQQTVVVDPVVDAIGRMSSHHSNTRRDAAINLGRLGDARGVPTLIDHLKTDGEKEVRQTCCWALVQIGDPQALHYLEQAAIHDKKKEVREAAQKAIAIFPREQTAIRSEPVEISSTAERPRGQGAQTRTKPPTPNPPTDDVPALPPQPEPVFPGYPK